MANDAAYPTERGEKRPGKGIFALQYTRILTKRALAQEVGPLAVLMLAIIVHQEDACHYRRGVTFYDAQFMFLLGINSKKTMTSIRRRLIDSGWLHYEPGHRGKASTYWVLVPAEAAGLDDKPTDESHDDCGSFREPNVSDSVPQSEQKGNRKGFDREPKGGLFIPNPIPDPNTPCEHVFEQEEERPSLQQHDLKNSLVLPPIATQRLKNYTPEVQAKAWSAAHRYREFCPGQKGTALMADFAAALADVVLEGGEQWLSTYCSPQDAVQIEAEVKAGKRLPPSASPWDVAKLYRALHKKPGTSSRPPVVPSNPTGIDPTLERLRAEKAAAEKNAAAPGSFTKGLKGRAKPGNASSEVSPPTEGGNSHAA